MELRHLRYFVAVAEDGNMTRAAERLGLQQPPLSQQIKALEQELGFELFRRVARGVELTAGGAAFLEDARGILAQVAIAARRASKVAFGMEGSVAVAFSTSAAAHAVVPRLISAFRSAHPRVTLDIAEGSAAELTDKVARGVVHAAIFRTPVASPAGVVAHPLLEEPMLLVLARSHPLARGAGAVALRALSGEGFILVRRPGAPGMYQNLIEACRNAGFTPRIVAEVERMLTNICLVAAGVGVSLVPASMRGFHPQGVSYHAIRGTPNVVAPMTLAYRAAEANPAALRFIALAKKFAASEKRRPGAQPVVRS